MKLFNGKFIKICTQRPGLAAVLAFMIRLLGQQAQ
jgi:hypothetical protein